MTYLPSFRALRHQRFFPLLTHLLLFVGVSLFFSFPASGGWMAQFSSKKITDLVIPGAHDAATSKIKWNSSIAKGDDMDTIKQVGKPIRGFMAKVSKAQNLSIAQQLEIGVRYLDLRIVFRESKKTHYTCHGLYSQSIDEVLQEVKSFVEKDSTEVIIVDVQKLFNMGNTHPDLLKKFQDAWGSYLASTDCLTKTVGQLSSSGKRIILLCDGCQNPPSTVLARSSYLDSKWHNKQSADELKKAIMGYTPSGSKISVTQAVLTPTAGSIAKGLLPGVPFSLKDFSKKVNKKLPDWLKEWKSQGKLKLNVIMVDFINKDLADKIIALNKPT